MAQKTTQQHAKNAAQNAVAEASVSPTKSNQGFLTNAANFLLSRLPWFRDRYETWGKGKKVIIALLLYIIVLPVIPIVIAIVMYIHDPEGFKRSKAFPILSAIVVAQLGLFGLIAAQPSKVTQPANSASTQSASTKDKKAALDNPAATTKKSKAELEQASKDSAPTNGKMFENCTAAFDAGVHDIKRGDPSYRPELDRDSDGFACEK